jgi:hypothetical protein
MYAVIHKARMNEVLGHPELCTLDVHETTVAVNNLPRPKTDYRVMRLVDGRVELAYTAHEWVREILT